MPEIGEAKMTRSEALKEFDLACDQLREAREKAKLIVKEAKKDWSVARDAFLKASAK